MDPEARRFMWRVVAAISQERKKSAVILTTHSMEEAEALSTKMGIMVTGGVFKCFGSAQHIKNKFGTGYEIEVKIRKITEEERKSLIHKFAPVAPNAIKGINEQATRGGMKLDYYISKMKDYTYDPFIASEIKEGGLGNDLVSEELETGAVDFNSFANWLYIEDAGMNIVNRLTEQFPSVEILEHYNDYFKLRIPRGDKTIGYVFGFIED
jgi:ATP-binding cassette subfamily A (ABC1) protein 3